MFIKNTNGLKDKKNKQDFPPEPALNLGTLSFKKRNQANSVGPLIILRYYFDPAGIQSFNNHQLTLTLD